MNITSGERRKWPNNESGPQAKVNGKAVGRNLLTQHRVGISLSL